MKKRFAVLLFLTLAVLALGGCAGDAVPPPDASPTPQPTATLPPTPDPEELARQAELETRRAQAVAQSQALADQYRYDEALAVLSDPALEGGEAVEAQYRHVLALKAALVPYEGELRHIFFHSLIVYPELVFTDLTTPMGGYNSGFAEKAELEPDPSPALRARLCPVRLEPMLRKGGWADAAPGDPSAGGEDPPDPVRGRRGLCLWGRLRPAPVCR